MRTKKKARRQLRRRLSTLTDREIFLESYAACLRLLATDVWREAGTVMLYQAMPRELDVSHVLLESLRLGKRVALPRIDRVEDRIEAVAIACPNHAITLDEHGIREPRDGAPLDLATLDLVVVPGLGFDRTCRRLGRGRAYYDRFMARGGFRARTCGIAFEQQILAEIPVDSHDLPVEMVITDRSTHLRRRH